MESSFSQFDLQRIQAESFVREVWYRREVASTSDLALELARSPREFPLLVLAERQTAGRGRGANRWWSGEGGLTFSLVLPWSTSAPRRSADGDPPLDARAASRPAPGWNRISLATAVAIRDALCQLVPGQPVGLKWPNDVYLAGRKICGILVELRPDAPDKLVLGIGLNVNNSFRDAPPEVRQLGTSLRDAAESVFSLPDVLIGLLRSLDDHLGRLREERLELVPTWQPHCILSGQWIEIDSGNRRWFGRCAGIQEDGALLLDTESGRQRCYSGVVRRRDSEASR